MAGPTLDDLDRTFADAPHPHLVEEMRLDPGGVDPLGLRQINLDLMDAALPGINNVTDRVRPYAFMAWAWWKVARAAEAPDGRAIAVSDLQDVVDRLEVLFVWSHFLAGDGGGLPGRTVVRGKLPAAGSNEAHPFHGEAWKAFRKVRRTSTGIMAPIQYGPSIRALGWLVQVEGRALCPSTEAMPAVTELDRTFGRRVPGAFMRPGEVSIDAAQAEALHPAWDVGEPSETERAVFRYLFHGLGETAPEQSLPWRRRRTLDLILAVLEQSPVPLTTEEVRRAMASASASAGEPLALSEQLVDVHRRWAALQARQLQRMALESLLRWIEGRIDAGRSRSEELARDADEAAREQEDCADAATVGEYLDAATARAGPRGWPAACGVNGETDVFALMDDLGAAQGEAGCPRVPGLALRGLAYADAMTLSLSALGVPAGGHGPLGGQPDRLPLSVARRRLGTARGRTLASLWSEILEAWVIGQHVRWSVARNGDDTQRLRIALGDRGWIRIRKGEPSGPFWPTSDRLWTALALGADCGLIERGSDAEGQIVFGSV